MAGVTQNKWRASSLLEVTIAMVILGLTVSLGMIMFIRITSSGAHQERLRAQTLANRALEQTEIDQTFFTNGSDEELLSVQKEVNTYPGTDDVFVVEVKVVNPKGEELAYVKQLIRSSQ